MLCLKILYCDKIIIIIMQKSTTINLHNIQQTIYLSYLSEDSFEVEQSDFETSYFSGRPIWLHCPSKSSCACENCGSVLTFFGQLYCPFSADYCYHRILYILFCQKCKHYFRCIRQQASKQWEPKCKQIDNEMQEQNITIKLLSQNSYELQCEPLSKKQLNNITQRTKLELEEEKAIEEADSDEEDDDQIENFDYEKQQMMQKIQNGQMKSQKLKKKQTKNVKQMVEMEAKEGQVKKQQIDYIFENYKKVMKQIRNPSMLYTNVPILYNNQPVNPKHLCRSCGSKLELEVELTEQLLLMNDKEASNNLLLMDWGTILIYTCSSSCKQSNQQELIVQFEIDPINEEEIKKLKKKKKNKKRAEQKAKSKSKSKSRSKSKEKEKDQEATQEVMESKDGDDEGDWD